MATKRKATKAKKPSNQVTTNFKQNHKRKPPGSKGGAVGGGGRPGRTQAEFDPEQNVRQDSPEAAEFAAEAPSSEVMPAAPAASNADVGQGNDFIGSGRSIPRMPDETV